MLKRTRTSRSTVRSWFNGVLPCDSAGSTRQVCLLWSLCVSKNLAEGWNKSIQRHTSVCKIFGPDSSADWKRSFTPCCLHLFLKNKVFGLWKERFILHQLPWGVNSANPVLHQSTYLLWTFFVGSSGALLFSFSFSCTLPGRSGQVRAPISHYYQPTKCPSH